MRPLAGRAVGAGAREQGPGGRGRVAERRLGSLSSRSLTAEATGPVLAIDLGKARIGLALSDPDGRMAMPLATLVRRNRKKDLAELKQVVSDHRVRCAVVGLPLLMSGEEGDAAAGARSFAERLRAAVSGLEVELWDERLTTVEAERMLAEREVPSRRRKAMVDSLAAMVILQSYLDAR